MMRRCMVIFETVRLLNAPAIIFTVCAIALAATSPEHAQAGVPRKTARATAVAAEKETATAPPFLDLGKIDPKVVWTLRGHTKAVNRVAFSASGTLLASAGDDSKLIVWNMNTGEPLRERPESSDPIWGLAWSPQSAALNANTVIVAPNSFYDSWLRMYDTISDEYIEVDAQRNHLHAIAINATGSLIAIGGRDRALRVLDTRRFLRDIKRDRNRLFPKYFEYSPPALPQEIWCIDFHPKSARKPIIAVGCTEGFVRLYEITGREPDDLKPSAIHIPKQEGRVTCVKFSPDGKLLATSGIDGMIRFRDSATGAIVRTISAVKSPVNWISFSPDGQVLADARDDKTVRLWKVANGEELRVLREHGAAVRGVAFGPDGRRLASCDANFVVLAWRLVPADEIPAKRSNQKR